MRKLTHFFVAAALVLAAVPCSAGIHYKSTTKTWSEGDRANGRNSDIQAEGWVAGEKAKVAFLESNGSPVAQQGTYILTKDGGKTLYLVNPQDKTYAQWDLQGMLGVVGAVMNGMGPLLKIQFSDPKTEKLAEDDGGLVAGVPTRHYKYRTSYTMTVKVLGMGNTANVVSEQDIWATTKATDAGLGVWLRAEPTRTGNKEFDKLLTSSAAKFQGFPLKVVTVSTSTQQKGNKQTVSHSTMEVTQLDASASVPASTFEIPAGYKETQIAPTQQGEAGDQKQEEEGGLRGLLKRKKGNGGDGGL
ncbi:MAG TPA: DUF4412 domain-containing protein [Thermoanaerobaculia bacterium]